MGGLSPVARSAPTMIAGLRDPSSILANRIIVDMDKPIHLYEPSAAPFTLLLNRTRGKREATQYQHDWMTQDKYPREVTLAGAEAAGDTTLDVSAGEGDRVAANWLMRNARTQEIVLITGVSTDALTAVRGIGGLNDAMDAGDKLVYLATAFEDGAGFGTMKSTQETRQFNYTQIIRTQYGFTGRQINTDLYGGKDTVTERQKQSIEHKKSIEYTMLFGRRHSRTGSGNKLQTMAGGVEYFVSSNVWDLDSHVPDENAVLEALEVCLAEGEGGFNTGGKAEKWAFCSARWMSIFSKMATSKLHYVTEDTQIGLKIMKYVSAFGTLMLVHDPILTGPYGHYLFGIDLNHVRYVYHQGRDTKLLRDRQGNDIDGVEEEFMTDCGLQLDLEAAHFIWKNIPS